MQKFNELFIGLFGPIIGYLAFFALWPFWPTTLLVAFSKQAKPSNLPVLRRSFASLGIQVVSRDILDRYFSSME